MWPHEEDVFRLEECVGRQYIAVCNDGHASHQAGHHCAAHLLHKVVDVAQQHQQRMGVLQLHTPPSTAIGQPRVSTRVVLGRQEQHLPAGTVTSASCV